MAKLTKQNIQNIVTQSVSDAVAFIQSEIAPDRIKAQKYFNGRVGISHEEGRSKVVATKVRDTIRAVKPALMRVFLQTDKPVEFIPRTQNAVKAAEQATSYAQYVFEQNDGFTALHGAFHDALIKKVGIIKVFYEETDDVEFDEYSGLTFEQATAIALDPEVEVIEQEVEENGSIEMKVSRKNTAGKIRFVNVAPEDFFVDRSATSIRNCYVCGHSTEGRVSDLVAMGFDLEEVLTYAGAKSGGTEEEEQLARSNFADENDDENALDPSMQKIIITEAYMRMDIEGTGVAKQYKFICAGDGYHILDTELCDYNPFAVFEVDPEPHAFFGRSLADIILDDQDASTSLLRGLLDSIAMANNPGVEMVEGQVNADDLLNNEIGRVVRVKAPGMIREFSIGNAASAALPAIQFYDETIRQKTGIIGAGMGLDADALQSQTAAGVRLADQTSNAVSELIARTLAEGGMRQLFESIAKLCRQHPDANAMMRLNGEFVPVDPTSWGSDMDVIANVGLGTGRQEERVMALNQAFQVQSQIWQAYGPGNGIVTMTNIRNTLADLLKLGGVYNADRYFEPMSAEKEQALMAQKAQEAAMAQQAGGQSDPNAAFLQAEQMKVSARVQTDMQKNQLTAINDAAKIDLERDKMAQDLAIQVAEILGKYGATIDVARLKQEQATNGMMGGMNGY